MGLQSVRVFSKEEERTIFRSKDWESVMVSALVAVCFYRVIQKLYR